MKSEVRTVDIKKAMLDHHLTIRALAARLGYARNTVSIAVNHPTMFPGVRKQILAELGFSK